MYKMLVDIKDMEIAKFVGEQQIYDPKYQTFLES